VFFLLKNRLKTALKVDKTKGFYEWKLDGFFLLTGDY
jgi:hypothetical protein